MLQSFVFFYGQSAKISVVFEIAVQNIDCVNLLNPYEGDLLKVF